MLVKMRKNNNITNAEFLLGKSEDVIKKLISQNVKLDAVIVDPHVKDARKVSYVI